MLEVTLKDWAERYSESSVFDYDRFTVSRGMLNWSATPVFIITNNNRPYNPVIFWCITGVAAVLGNVPESITGLMYIDQPTLLNVGKFSDHPPTVFIASSSSALTELNGARTESAS